MKWIKGPHGGNPLCMKVPSWALGAPEFIVYPCHCSHRKVEAQVRDQIVLGHSGCGVGSRLEGAAGPGTWGWRVQDPTRVTWVGLTRLGEGTDGEFDFGWELLKLPMNTQGDSRWQLDLGVWH